MTNLLTTKPPVTDAPANQATPKKKRSSSSHYKPRIDTEQTLNCQLQLIQNLTIEKQSSEADAAFADNFKQNAQQSSK